MVDKLVNNPVFTSLDVSRHEDQLLLVQNFYDGVDTAQNSLIQYTKESDESFAKRLQMLTLSNYVRQSIDSVQNIIFRKQIDQSEIDGTALAPYLDTIDYKNNLMNFAKQVTVNAFKDGYTLILVEKEPYSDEVVTKADEDGVRPYFVNIPRKMVRNYKINSRGEYEMITYDESYISQQNQYSQVVSIQQRTYFSDGTVEIWRTDAKKRAYLHETYQNGLSYIPIIKVGNHDIPPLYDLARINANFLNLQSERRNYARIAAAPIPVMYQPDNNDGKLVTIGVSDGVSFSAPKTDAGFEWVELKGNNDKIISDLMAEDEKAMRSYIVELINTSIQRTATEVAMDGTSNESKLSHYAEITEDAINKAFAIMAEYQGITGFDAKIYISRDFYNSAIDAQMVGAYQNMYIQGIISWEKLMELLINGEVMEPMTDEEMQTEKARLNQ